MVRSAFGALLVVTTSCDDTGVHRTQRDTGVVPEYSVELLGSYCTSEPGSATFPVKVLFIIDDSTSMAAADANNGRLNAARTLINNLYDTSENIFFGIERLNVLTQMLTDPPFTRDRADLEWALRNQQHVPLGCTPYRGALDLARETIESDLRATPTVANRTQYVVIFLSDGAPKIGRIDCLPEVWPYDEIKEKTQAIKDLQSLGEIRAGGVTIHTAYLQDGAYDTAAASLLSDMAEIGKGEFRDFPNGDAIDFSGFAIPSVERVYAPMSSLLVTNLNVFVDREGAHVDSDADGMTDAEEISLGTNPDARDTDGDSCGDLMEAKYADWDPLTAGWEVDPPHCVCKDDERINDSDGDSLTDCEEIWLDLQWTRPDSDVDERNGRAPDYMLDALELSANLARRKKDDTANYDMDDVSNRLELATHMNPHEADNDMRDVFAYRYDYVGQQAENAACFDFQVSNVHILNTAKTDTHAQGENFILLYFVEAPQAEPFEEATVNYVLKRVPYADQVGRPPIEIKPEDFKIMGL